MEILSPRYSVCITNYNKAELVLTSMESLFSEIDQRVEVVVVDNMSTDGSEETLRRYARDGAIRLLEKKCSRGMGREIAFEGAKGEYVISGFDTDDVLIPYRLQLLLDFYHAKCEGKLLRVMESGFVAAPAEVIRMVGGWRDLQFSENSDIAERAAKMGRYAWTIFKVKEVIRKRGPLSFMEEHKQRYGRYLDWLRLRRSRSQMFANGEEIGVQKRIDYSLARIALLRRGRLNSVPSRYDDHDPQFYVESREWWHRTDQDEREEVKWYTRRMGKPPEWGI